MQPVYDLGRVRVWKSSDGYGTWVGVEVVDEHRRLEATADPRRASREMQHREAREVTQ